MTLEISLGKSPGRRELISLYLPHFGEAWIQSNAEGGQKMIQINIQLKNQS